MGKIPSFTVELGTGDMPDLRIVASAIAGTRNVLRWAGMLSGDMEPLEKIIVVEPGFQARRSRSYRAEVPCISIPMVRPGNVVKPGDPQPYIEISSILFADDKIKEAREIIKQGLEASPDSEDKAQLYLKYYSYSFKLKDYKGAREVLPKIRKLTKDNRILNWTRQQEKKLDNLEGKSGE